MNCGRLFSLCSALVLAGLVSQTNSAKAIPTPLHAYEFDNGLIDSGYGNVVIAGEGGVVSGGFYNMNPTLPSLGGDANNGLTLTSPGLTNPGVYSIEMYLQYDSNRSISNHHWLKLIDFEDASESLGLYYEDMAFSTRFSPNPATPGESSLIKYSYTSAGGPPNYAQSGSVMSGGEWNHIVFVRDAGGTVTAYIDGNQVFTSPDPAPDAVFSGTNNVMRFLQNDLLARADGYYEVGAGSLDFLRIYDSALTGGDVSALAAAAIVPEPASLVLLALVGSAAVTVTRLRK